MKLKEAIGADLYNHNLTGWVAMSLTGCRADPHKIPCVIEEADEDNDIQSDKPKRGIQVR